MDANYTRWSLGGMIKRWLGKEKTRDFYVHMTVHRNKLLFNETNRRTRFQIYFLYKTLQWTG